MTVQDDFFARLVAEEVKGKVTSAQSEFLRLPENWTRWQRALRDLVENLNDQLRKIESEEKQDELRYSNMGTEGLRLRSEASLYHEDRKRKISRFRFHVESRVDEVTRMIVLGSPGYDDDMMASRFLRRAIEEHRAHIKGERFDSDEVDEALWAALEGAWTFDVLRPSS